MAYAIAFVICLVVFSGSRFACRGVLGELHLETKARLQGLQFVCILAMIVIAIGACQDPSILSNLRR